MITTSQQPRRLGRSIAAVLLGFVAVVVLSIGTDQVLHVFEVYPPWGQPMNDTSDNLLALAYRCVYGVVGSYLTARFAPHSPMLHAMVGGGIGFVLSTAGAIAAIGMNLGPMWYPVALALTALPCAWLGGVLHARVCRSSSNAFPAPGQEPGGDEEQCGTRAEDAHFSPEFVAGREPLLILESQKVGGGILTC